MSVTITASSTLVESYRLASPVTPNKKIVSVTDAGGNAHVFSVGSDQKIREFIQNSGQEAEWEVQTMAPEGVIELDACLNTNGELFVFYSQEEQLGHALYFLSKPLEGNWSDPIRIVGQSIRSHSFRNMCSGIVVKDANYMAVQYDNSFRQVVLSSYQKQAKGYLYMVLTDKRTNSEQDAFIELIQAQKAFPDFVGCAAIANHTDGGSSLLFVNPNKDEGPKDLNLPMDVLDMTAVMPGDRPYSQIFALLADQSTYYLDQDAQEFKKTHPGGAPEFTAIRAGLNPEGRAEIFGLSTDGRLYHCYQLDLDSEWSEMVLISNLNFANNFSVSSASFGGSECFAVSLDDENKSSLYHIFQDPETTNWNIYEVETDSPKELERLSLYAVDISFIDDKDIKIPAQNYSVWSDTPCELIIDGDDYFVDKDHHYSTTSEAKGASQINIPVNGLVAPILKVSTPGMEENCICIQPNSGVQQKLMLLDGSDLMENAKDAEGNLIVPEKYRTEDTTNAVAEGIRRSMSLVSSSETSAFTHINDENLFRKIDLGALKGSSSWRLRFDHKNSKVEFKELNQDPQQELDDYSPNCPHISQFLDSNSLQTDWGSVWNLIKQSGESVVANLNEIQIQVVHGAEGVVQAIEARLELLINGAQYFYKATVDLVEQVFDIVEGIFAEIKVAFGKLFEWLGFVFDWQDILRTKEVLTYTITEHLNFMAGAIPSLKPIFRSGISQLGQRLQDAFDNSALKQWSDNGISNQSHQFQPKESDLLNALQNNFLLDALFKGPSSSALPLIEMTDNPALDKFKAQIKIFSNNLQASQSFTDLQGLVDNLQEDTENLLTGAFAGMISTLKELVQWIFSNLANLSDLLLDAINSLISSFIEMLTQPFNIPLISELYSNISGDDKGEISIVDVFSLILACGISPVYKMAFNASPFPDSQSVEDVKLTLSAKKMLQNANGFGPKNSQGIVAEVQSDFDFASFQAVATAVAHFSLGIVNAGLDLQEVIVNKGGTAEEKFGAGHQMGNKNAHWGKKAMVENNKLLMGLQLGVLITGLFNQGINCPWITKTGEAAWSECGPNATADQFENALWCFQTLMPLADVVFMIAEQKLMAFVDPIGQTTSACLGANAFAGAFILDDIEGGAYPAKTTQNALSALPALFKFLRYEPIVGTSKGYSLWALSAMDLAGDGGAAITQIARATN